MAIKKIFDTTKLCQLMKKNYKGSMSVAVDDALGNLIESLRNYVLENGEEHDSLPKRVEVTDH